MPSKRQKKKSDYEMYKIHRQGQPHPKGSNKSKNEEEEKEKVTVIPIQDDEEMRRLERKKRTQEDMVADFVKILEQMMNPRQAVTSFCSGVTGICAIIVALLYVGRLPDTAYRAKELVTILIVYGVLQILLATAFFVTCMQTSIAVSKGVKAFQIVVGLVSVLIYLGITTISAVIGIFGRLPLPLKTKLPGFYKTISLVSFVEYDSSSNSSFFCPQPVFYTALGVFTSHICLIVVKFCCCK